MFVSLKEREAGIIMNGCTNPLEASKYFLEFLKEGGTNLGKVDLGL